MILSLAEKMLVVVFDDETKAFEGSSALKQLDGEGSVSIHAETVVKKNPDGSLAMKELGDDFPVRTAAGTAIGALVGLLGAQSALELESLPVPWWDMWQT